MASTKRTIKKQSNFNLRRKLFYILLFVFSNITGTAQQFEYEWHSMFDYAKHTYGDAVTTDSYENIYTTGFFSDTIVIAGDTVTSDAAYPFFLLKYDKDGNVLWHRYFENELLWIFSLTTDSEDNLYMSGMFSGTWELPETDLVSRGSIDGFLVSYDKEGDFRWAKSAGSEYIDFQWFVESDGLDGIYVTGKNEHPPFIVSDDIILEDFYAYIIKYNTEGEAQWAYNYGGDIYSLPGEIYADKNEVIVTGAVGGKMLLDTNIVADKLSAMIVNFDLNGNFKKAAIFGGEECTMCIGTGIAKDYDNNLYLTGNFKDILKIEDTTLTSYGDTNDNFILKLNDKWEKDWLEHVKNDGYFDLYDIKYLNGNLFFSAEAGNDTSINICDTVLQPVYDDDNYIIILSEEGNLNQVMHSYGSGTPEIRDIAVTEYDNYLNLYFTGVFGNEITFPGFELTSENGVNYFLNKYSLELPEIPDTIKFDGNFLIYPNPSADFFNIKYKDISPEQIYLDIYDIKGKHLFSQSYSTSDNNLIENINISHLSNGLYLLKIHYEGTLIYKKLIVSR